VESDDVDGVVTFTRPTDEAWLTMAPQPFE
jgi:hypothetical protein